ncbi:hypothetical protein S40288_07603 [Stachybotrys chartarum IBT 40288]|nr:hypothetical protein S40288_07603 [Stachybotrys chartarum IBT 40288]
MSLRRRSCEACFRGRRKCNLAFPTCQYCRKTKRSCHYPYRPQQLSDYSFTGEKVQADSAAQTSQPVGSQACFLTPSATGNSLADETAGLGHDYDWTNYRRTPQYMHLAIPNQLGTLGDPQSVSGSDRSWQWVVKELKYSPATLVQFGESTFIHKSLYQDALPPSIRTAFGICAAHLTVPQANTRLFFRSLEAEAAELLKSTMSGTIPEELSKLQAAALYLIIGLLHGGVEERVHVERQERRLMMMGLRLLRRADQELNHAELKWETWILAESIRRTVMVIFLVYGLYSLSKDGICCGFPTMGVLPVSTSASSWISEGSYARNPSPNATTTYGDFTQGWVASPARKLEPFEKLLLVACKGIDAVEILSLP